MSPALRASERDTLLALARASIEDALGEVSALERVLAGADSPRRCGRPAGHS